MIPKPDVDTTIEDLHRTRERLAAKFGGNIRAILDDARRRQAASQRPTWQGKSPNKEVLPTTTQSGDHE